MHFLHTQVHSKEQPLKVILESQYRPTQGNHVIEVCSILPACTKFQTSSILEIPSAVAAPGKLRRVCLCMQLPAGLIDAGETAAQAALRELKEETGRLTCCSERLTVSPQSLQRLEHHL